MADWSARNARTLLNVLQAAGQARDLRVLSFRDHSLRGEIFSPSEDLSGADLRDADLSDAQLSGVRLADASLAGARLESSHLDGANLNGADLSDAVLDRASLIGADLTGCKLDGTSWRRARLIGAQVDLTATPAERLLGASLPDSTPRLCISGPVTSCVFAISGNLTLLAAHADDGVQLWDLATERCLTVLPIEREQVEDIAFGDLSDGRAILAGSGSDGAVRIWDPTTGEHLHTLAGAGGKGPRLAFTQLTDGRTILATGGGYDDRDDDDSLDLSLGVIHIWNPVTGEHLSTLTHHGSKIKALTFGALPDGHTILAAGVHEKDSRGYSVGVIHICDPTTGEHLSTLTGPHSNVSRLAFGELHDGRTTLATGSGQLHENIYLLDPTTGQQLGSLPADGEVSGAITFARFPDGRTILAGVTQNENIRLWDPTTKETLRTLTGNNLILELASAQLPDGRTVFVSGSIDHGHGEYIELWDAVTGHPRPLSDGHRWILTVTFMQLPDGRTILAGGSGDGPVHLWDAVTAEHLSTLTGHDDRVVTVASAQLPDGRTILASASESHKRTTSSTTSRTIMHVWDPVTGERLNTVTDSRGLAQTMALTELADGRTMLTTGGGYVDRDSHKTHGVIHLRDLATEERLSTLTDHDNWVWATALTQLPGGRTILATGTSGYDKERNSKYGVIHIWDALTGQHLNKLIGHNDTIRELEFTQLPDGRTILASCGGDEYEGGDGKVHLWDPITGRRVHTFTDDRNMRQTISFVRLLDGRAVLAIGSDNTVGVWDLTRALMPRRRFFKARDDGSPPDMAPSLICTYRFPAQVAALAWSRETSSLAAGLANESVVLSRLDGTSLSEQATLLTMPEGNATLYPDGSYRLTGDPNGRLWWSAGLCRFEPGELDGYAGIRRL